MNPAFSVVVFTTIAGAAQGLVVVLACALLGGVPMAPGFVPRALLIAAVMLAVGLGASFLHLGRPERAWRAAAMWRTSWLSREVIVLPMFIAGVLLAWAGLAYGAPSGAALAVGAVAAIAGAAALWYCTAMIYACLRFIEEWAQPATVVNFVLVGLSSGLVLACVLAAAAGEAALLAAAGPAAAVLTAAAGLGRWYAVRRNAGIRHRSTLQSATGIHAPQLKQKSMGMSAGSFNTREFFHRASAATLGHVKQVAALAGFAAPALLAVWGSASGAVLPWALAVALQAVGLVADRWLFFAQAKHPQNLYYQVVS